MNHSGPENSSVGCDQLPSFLPFLPFNELEETGKAGLENKIVWPIRVHILGKYSSTDLLYHDLKLVSSYNSWWQYFERYWSKEIFEVVGYSSPIPRVYQSHSPDVSVGFSLSVGPHISMGFCGNLVYLKQGQRRANKSEITHKTSLLELFKRDHEAEFFVKHQAWGGIRSMWHLKMCWALFK